MSGIALARERAELRQKQAEDAADVAANGGGKPGLSTGQHNPMVDPDQPKFASYMRHSGASTTKPDDIPN